MQFHQLEEILVADALLQFLFGGGYIVVDLFQILKEPDGGRVDNPQDQVQFVVDNNAFAARMLDEVGYQLRMVVADGDDDPVIGDDADGDSDERDTTLVALHGNTQDGQQPVALGFRTRAFVHVGYIFKK